MPINAGGSRAVQENWRVSLYVVASFGRIAHSLTYIGERSARLSDHLIFYGLLHISDVVRPGINMPRGVDPLDAYVRCAALSARSFAAHDVAWHLVTNHQDRVRARVQALGISGLSIKAFDFKWELPFDIPFRSAHHKLELFEAFATGKFGRRPGLVDLDTVLLRPFPQAMLDLEGLIGFEITGTEIPDYGVDVLTRTIASITGRALPPRWWGGEFLLGRAKDYAQLSAAITAVWPSYLARWRDLHHQGDEAVLAGAVALLSEAGGRMTDAGALGTVHRWWSARTRSPRPALSTALETSLLHLPADKEFLAAYDANHRDLTAFVPLLRRHARHKILSRRALGGVERLLGRKRRYAPRL